MMGGYRSCPRRKSSSCPLSNWRSGRPYTVAGVLIFVCLLRVGAAERVPVDIFPEIDIPAVSVVWTYNGMRAEDIQDRILSVNQRQLASLVDNIPRIEATGYEGSASRRSTSTREPMSAKPCRK
jgi:multidrug efflux pump subunit AcrB